MGVSLQPDQNQQPPVEQGNIPPTLELPNEQNQSGQPTNNQQSPLDSLAVQAWREANARAATAEQELARYKNSQPSAPQTPANPQDYWNNPIESNRNVVREELSQMLAPFQRDFDLMRRQQQYGILKAQMRNSIPNFNMVEATVDQAMSTMEPTAQNFGAAVSFAFGQLYLGGQLPSATPTTPTAPVVTRPPYVAPSAPPAPQNPINNNAPAPLTEMERRMMREGKFKDEAEFIKFRDMGNVFHKES